MKISLVGIVGAVAVAALAVTIGVFAQSGSANLGAPAASDDAPTDTSELMKHCKSGMASVGTLDVIPPSSADEAKENGWATSPDAAAQRTLGSAMLFPKDALGELTVDKGRNVIIPSSDREEAGDEGVRATEYLVTNADGATVGIITIQPQAFDTYAAMSTQRCAA